MAGLYALTLSVIQKIRREHWGNPVSSADLENGNTKDPGLQSFVDELAFALADEGAIQMPATLDLIAPKNAPAIRIHGDGGITIINEFNETINLNFETINNITNNITNITNVIASGIDATVLIPATYTVSVVGCTATVSIATYTTLTFTGGVLTGVV